jgi:hypothetical protein
VIRILGIDPGGTTGFADLIGWPGYYHVEPTQLRGRDTGDMDPVGAVKAMLGIRTYTVVAMERFVVSRRAGRSKTSGAGEQARNIIGAVTSLCQEAGVPVVLRSASQVKAWATDNRLEAAGLLAPTRGLPHARDATRHALYAAVWDCGLPDPLSGRDNA